MPEENNTIETITNNENKNIQGTKNKEIADTLNTSTIEDYFKDIEKTGRFPKKIEELLKEGEWCESDIIEHIRDELGIKIIRSKEKLLGFLPKEKQFEIRKLAINHFKTFDSLTDYSGREAPECSDGSDLYTLVKYDGKICLAKLACGEFNRNTFIKGVDNSRVLLYKSDIPLFVVNQHNSYFAGPGSIEADIRNIDPRLYLSLYSVIFSPKGGEAYKRYTSESSIPIDWSKIRIPDYNELVKTLEKPLQKD